MAWVRRLIKRMKAKGYHMHTCWKCGVKFMDARVKGTYLPSRKEYKQVCPKCRQKMGI